MSSTALVTRTRKFMHLTNLATGGRQVIARLLDGVLDGFFFLFFFKKVSHEPV